MRAHKAFTLIEMMVSLTVLVIIVIFVSQMVNSATALSTGGNKRMDTDTQARLLLDRMAVDFTQMVRRSDVDYFVKQPSNPEIGSSSSVGANDQIAFFSGTTGYSPATATSAPSPLSLVAYRVNSYSASNAYTRFERMGKALVWNSITPPPSVTPTPLPMVFLPATISSVAAWSAATQPSPSPVAGYIDPDYELAGPQVFRFEYYYLLKNGNLSDTPWDTTAGHTGVAGMRDVAAICVVIAIIDPRSRLEIPATQVDPNPSPAPAQPTLAAQMRDFSMTMHQPGNGATKAGDLAAQWQSVLDTATTFRVPVTGIRIYQRNFYLSPVK